MSIDPWFDNDPDWDDYTPGEGATCKRCGASGLEWEKQDNRWVLVEADYTPHVCTAFNASVNDFEVLK